MLNRDDALLMDKICLIHHIFLVINLILENFFMHT